MSLHVFVAIHSKKETFSFQQRKKSKNISTIGETT